MLSVTLLNITYIYKSVWNGQVTASSKHEIWCESLFPLYNCALCSLGRINVIYAYLDQRIITMTWDSNDKDCIFACTRTGGATILNRLIHCSVSFFPTRMTTSSSLKFIILSLRLCMFPFQECNSISFLYVSFLAWTKFLQTHVTAKRNDVNKYFHSRYFRCQNSR